MKDGCCCGATKSNPCICMKKGITKCSSKAPKCPCYAEMDKKDGKKKSFEKAWNVAKELDDTENIMQSWINDTKYNERYGKVYLWTTRYRCMDCGAVAIANDGGFMESDEVCADGGEDHDWEVVETQ